VEFPQKNLWIKEHRLSGECVLEVEESLESLGLTIEKLSDPIGQGIEAEVGDTEDALGSS